MVDPVCFEMTAAFNCKELKKPFGRTAEKLRAFCEEVNMEMKLEVFMEIPEVIKGELYEHQEKLIAKGELK